VIPHGHGATEAADDCKEFVRFNWLRQMNMKCKQSTPPVDRSGVSREGYGGNVPAFQEAKPELF
jgi:hypothetical protein